MKYFACLSVNPMNLFISFSLQYSLSSSLFHYVFPFSIERRFFAISHSTNTLTHTYTQNSLCHWKSIDEYESFNLITKRTMLCTAHHLRTIRKLPLRWIGTQITSTLIVYYNYEMSTFFCLVKTITQRKHLIFVFIIFIRLRINLSPFNKNLSSNFRNKICGCFEHFFVCK